MSVEQSGFLLPCVRTAVSVALGVAALAVFASQVAGAQEGAANQAGAAKEAPALQEVVVTGSRIVRKDMVSNSPLVTVDSAALESQSGLNVESYLNQLPNFNPSAAPTMLTGPGSNSDVQISAVNSVGIASVSLRGFGPNRSLVLVDGHRTTPVNALMVTDIDSIPSSMIKRVEIISGGASATYGADAIGGVTNFILRRDFEGLELDAQTGVNQAGDGAETRGSAIMGSKIGDGRGNIVMAMEYYDRRAAYERNNSFFRKGWADPNTPGSAFGFFGYNDYSTGFSTPNINTVNTLLNNPPGRGTGAYAFPGSGVLSAFKFNSDGTIFDNIGNNNTAANSPFAYYKGPIDGKQFAYQNVYDTSQAPGTGPKEIQTLKYDDQQALTSSPQTRYSFMTSGSFDITDNVKFFADARYADSKTTTFLIPTNASYGWEASIPYNPTTDSPVNPALDYTNQANVAAVLANPAAFANPNFIAHGAAGAQHPVPVQLAVLLNSRAAASIYCLQGSAGCGAAGSGTTGTTNPTLVGGAVPGTGRLGSWIAETYPLNSFPQRQTVDNTSSWQIETGVDFKLPFRDWTGEVYYSRGESDTYNIAYGDNSLTRWRAAVTAADYGANATFQNNLNGASPGFGTVKVHCTSGFYNTLFSADAVPSSDCQAAVEANLQTRTQNQQDIGELNFQGGLFNLPTGEVRAAFGFQHRRNSAQFIPDILQSTESFADQVIGVYPTGALNAQTQVNDYYGELLVPVASDLKFLKKAEIETGARYSDYDKTSSTVTFKVLANLEFNNYARFRGGFNRSTRAPNLGELFLNQQETFAVGGANFGDPCGLLSNATYGAGGAIAQPVPGQPATHLAAGQTAAGAQSAYLICQAQMGTAASFFYGPGGAGPAGGATGSLFNFLLQQGNPNLKSETADTWSAGFVFASPFENDVFHNMSATVDYYMITINHAIEQYSTDYARYLCYGTVTVTDAVEAAAQAASSACQNVSRNSSSGAANTVLIAYDNQATIKTSGVDVALNWFSKMSDMHLPLPGGFGVNIDGTWLDYYKTKQSPASFDVLTDWKGSLGPTLSGTNAGAYGYRVFTNFNYVLPKVSFSLRWRFLPSVVQASKAAQQAIIKNDTAVAAGGGGVLLNYTPDTTLAVPHYNILDMSFNWNITSFLAIRGGIDNLFNAVPPITTALAGYPTGTNLTAVCGGKPGCVNPTNYVIPNDGSGNTNGGYYDILGRRFFLGFKATF